MYNIYSALSSTSTDYGITRLKVFYDTLMIEVKCKDDGFNHSYYGHVLFDKINYNYTEFPLQSNKSIVLNLGLLNSDVVQPTGNGVVDAYFDQNEKSVTLFTVSALDNSFMPKIYKYDINNHNIAMQYPTDADKPTWTSSVLGSLTAYHPPLLSVSDTTADVLITTVTNEFRILNVLTFDITSKPELINYSKYSVDLGVTNVIKKIQRVDNELQFYSSNQQNITPFKIVDK
jgi:hypothetical protein